MSENTTSYLSFVLDGKHFAVNVAKVIEILEVPKITSVPRSPSYLKGVINLRGNVLPVIDTRVKFQLSPIELKVDTCIIVMEIEIDDEEVILGAMVDSVSEVLEIQPSDIKPSPSIGSKYNPEFIDGVVKVDDDFVMFLNIGKVFNTDEIQLFNDASAIEMES